MGQDAVDLGGGIGLTADQVALSADDVLGRSCRAAGHLHGPRGYLQGGLCAGLLVGVARLNDPIAAPVTGVDVDLREPAPLQERLGVVDHVEGAGEHRLELLRGDRILAEGRVELQGHELRPRAYDLAELARVPLPAPTPHAVFAECWVCGGDNPDGLGLLPGWHADGRVVTGWVPEPDLAPTGVLDPILVLAVLDCPTLWCNRHELAALGLPAALLVRYQVRFYGSASAYEPLRTVAISDGADGRKLRARSALVDDDGAVYAIASALWLAVDALPER